MFCNCALVSFLFFRQLQGSRLGGPKEDNIKGTSWAFQDSDRHTPPGMVAKSGKSDGFDHAWAKEGKQPMWQSKMPQTDDVPLPEPVGMPMQVGAGARKVLQPEKDAEMEPEVVAKYDAKTKITSDSASGMSTDLQSTLDQDCRNSMTLKDFMPKCLKHVKSLIADLDMDYGDAQLETTLLNWCKSAEEFPHARGSPKIIGFRDHQTCTNFASDLKNARYSELKSTSDKGYQDFCTAFYGHHGGFEFEPKPRVKEETPNKSISYLAGPSMVVASLTLCLL